MLASIALARAGATPRCYNIRMGTFFHPMTVVGPAGEETVEALVDTGASFSSMPTSLLSRLGLTPHRRASLKLADGRVAEYGVGHVHARIDGVEEDSLFIFGAEDAPPVIGAHTLQSMLLGVNPVDHTLVPVEGFFMASTTEDQTCLAPDF